MDNEATLGYALLTTFILCIIFYCWLRWGVKDEE